MVNQPTEIAQDSKGAYYLIRGIRTNDKEMQQRFVASLSPESRYYRFLGAISRLTPEMLKQLCEVDGNCSMAFVATTIDDNGENIIGVSRFARGNEHDAREMSIAVSDKWQHQGIGTLLANKLIEFAKLHGIKHLYSVDLAHNERMKEFAKGIGMGSAPDPTDPHNVIYSLEL